MSNENDGNQPGGGQQQGGGDWGNDDGWGDQPQQQQQQPSPGVQGQPQQGGGQWGGGQAGNQQTATPNQPNQGQAQPNANAGFGNQQQGGQMQAQPPSQAPQSGGADDLTTNDIIAIVLSFFFPGVGHMMLGQTTKGIVMLAVFVFTCGGLGLLPFASIFDAFLLAKTVKYRAVDDWEFFPDMNEHL